MAKINWLEQLGWTDDHLDDLRLAGYAYIRQGKYDIALKFFKALSALDPNSAYDSQTLAALYVEIGEPEKSLPYFDRALQLETDHAPTMLNLCKAFFMMGKVEEGLRIANLLKKEPNSQISNMAKALLLAYGPLK
ncbi:MAG: hypothetical protein Tsb0021_16460 [Chlamydiales bacterium]